MRELKGSTAVITGGASGIGLATARSLAREGVKLVLADIEQTRLSEAVAALKANGAEAVGIATDVTDKSSVERLADQAWSRFGAVHIVFNNAGVAVFGPTQSNDPCRLAMDHECQRVGTDPRRRSVRTPDD